MMADVSQVLIERHSFLRSRQILCDCRGKSSSDVLFQIKRYFHFSKASNKTISHFFSSRYSLANLAIVQPPFEIWAIWQFQSSYLWRIFPFSVITVCRLLQLLCSSFFHVRISFLEFLETELNKSQISKCRDVYMQKPLPDLLIEEDLTKLAKQNLHFSYGTLITTIPKARKLN